MHCMRCNTKNLDDANYCYKCGESFNRINEKNIRHNIPMKKSFSFKELVYENIILSKKKYRNVFILLSIMVLCSVLSIPLLKGLPQSFNSAMTLVEFGKNQLAEKVLKSQTEQLFRDVFLRFIFIFVFYAVFIFNTITLIYAYILKRKIKKENKN